MQSILHLVAREDWAAVDPLVGYRPASLAHEGFIHCTIEAEILLGIANSIYRADPREYVVLEVDPARVASPVVVEGPLPPPPPDSPLAQHQFPHIYGPLNVDAVVGVRPAVRDVAGTFISL
jgi:hypothetical protein